MSRSGAMDRIDALLGGISDPAFVGVLRGEPLAISGTQCLRFGFQLVTQSPKLLQTQHLVCRLLFERIFVCKLLKLFERQ